MTALATEARPRAAAALLFARTVYAFNWYNVGAVLPLLASGLGVPKVELGVVLGAFLAGAGIFQLPAGLIAMRFGNRSVSIAALGSMGAFCLASAWSPNWETLAGLRFGAGASAAFFFAPALGLVSTYFPAGSRGPIVGLYNAGFSIGAAVGVAGGALVGASYGWPAALALGGVVLLGSTLAAPFLLPRTAEDETRRRPSAVRVAVARVVRSRSLWALAFGYTGLWAAFYLGAQYFVQFASVDHPAWSIALAALIPTVFVVAEVPGAPFGGWLAERSRDMRRILLGAGAVAGVAMFLIPFSPLAGLFAVFVLLGVADGITFAVMYLIPSYLPDTRDEGVALALALLNAVQIFGGSGIVLAFGAIAATAGYAYAWTFSGAVALALLPLVLWLERVEPGGGARLAKRATPPGLPG